MDQVTAFSPPLVCKLIDGSVIRFARIKNKMWTAIAAEMNAPRIRAQLDDIAADKTIPPREAAIMRRQAMDSIVPIQTAMDRCMIDIEWTERLLKLAAIGAGHTEEEAAKALDLIPPMEQMAIANQIAMLVVVKNVKRGTESNPLEPGLDLDHQTDSTLEKPADSSATI